VERHDLHSSNFVGMHQIKEDEMDGEHSTHGRCDMHTKLLPEKLKGGA
jgi:hypothetical protein